MNYEDDDLLFGIRERTLKASAARKARVSVPHMFIGGIEHKSCALCGSLKVLSEFGVDKQKSDSLRSRCKPCDKH